MAAELTEPGARRDETFIAQAMDDFGDAVFRLALAQTRSKADAEDVYQDVYLRLYNDDTVFQSPDHLRAWLLRVTVNRCHDLAKSAWKRHTVAFDPERDDVAAPTSNPQDAELWDAVGQLPDNLRSAVHLHYVEGYSTEEVSRILDCQPATARSWLYRARSAVRELLEHAQSGVPSNQANATSSQPRDLRKEALDD